MAIDSIMTSLRSTKPKVESSSLSGRTSDPESLPHPGVNEILRHFVPQNDILSDLFVLLLTGRKKK
jgi:hypothetical protein